jgi:hypothetical protein
MEQLGSFQFDPLGGRRNHDGAPRTDRGLSAGRTDERSTSTASSSDRQQGAVHPAHHGAAVLPHRGTARGTSTGARWSPMPSWPRILARLRAEAARASISTGAGHRLCRGRRTEAVPRPLGSRGHRAGAARGSPLLRPDGALSTRRAAGSPRARARAAAPKLLSALPRQRPARQGGRRRSGTASRSAADGKRIAAGGRVARRAVAEARSSPRRRGRARDPHCGRGARALAQAEVELAVASRPVARPRGRVPRPLDPLLGPRPAAFDYVTRGSTSRAQAPLGATTCCPSLRHSGRGRIEPRIERATRRSRSACGGRDGVDPRDTRPVDAVRDALADYLTFAGADRLRWGAGLSRPGRLFGTPRPNRSERRSA